jgi:hypothetical protein
VPGPEPEKAEAVLTDQEPATVEQEEPFPPESGAATSETAPTTAAMADSGHIAEPAHEAAPAEHVSIEAGS